MAQLYTNNAVSTLALAIGTSATTINVATGHGARFASPSGSDYQMVTLTTDADPTTYEIVKVTSRAGDVLTVIRAQEGTIPRNWAVAVTKVEARLTAGMMGNLVQDLGTAPYSLAIASTDFSASATGGSAIAVGSNASAAGAFGTAVGDTASSGGDASTALGRLANASGTSSVSVGQSSVANFTGAVAVGAAAHGGALYAVATGDNAFATGLSSVAVGRKAVASGEEAVAIGSLSGPRSTAELAGFTPWVANAQAWRDSILYNASGELYLVQISGILDSVPPSGDGLNGTARLLYLGLFTDIGALRSVNVGASSVAGSQGVAVGEYANGVGQASVAVGSQSAAKGPYSIALGTGSHATGVQAVSLGGISVARGKNSVALNGTTYGLDGFAGPRSYQYADSAWNFRGHPTIQRDDWHYNFTRTTLVTGVEGIFSANYMDLGGVPVHQTSHVYKDGDVVKPATPNGLQYHLWLDYDAATDVNQLTSHSVAPTWPTADGDSVEADDPAVGNHYWICVDLSTGVSQTLPRHTMFFPTEIGFICFNYNGVTSPPYVSFGAISSPGNLINNQPLSQITGSNQIHRFTSLPNIGIKGPTDGITFSLNTPAGGTNSQFHGRFYVKGIFINTQE